MINDAYATKTIKVTQNTTGDFEKEETRRRVKDKGERKAIKQKTDLESLSVCVCEVYI